MTGLMVGLGCCPVSGDAADQPFVRDVTTGYLLRCSFLSPRPYCWPNKETVKLSEWDVEKNGGTFEHKPGGVALEGLVPYRPNNAIKVANAGLPGIQVLMELRQTDVHALRTMQAVGVDAACAYTWGTPAANQQRSRNIGLGAAPAQAGVGLLPSISMGWDRSPWGVQDGGWLPPADYQALAAWAKNEFAPGLPANSLGRRVLMLANWNEFDEGHFLMPLTLAGFGYLDALRDVFTEGGDHEDAAPGEQQSSRFTTLYPRE